MAPDPLQDLSLAFEEALHRTGLHGALRFLNARTPHRFTGLYCYDGANLRNIALFAQFNPDQVEGNDAPMEKTPSVRWYRSLAVRWPSFHLKSG